MPNTAQPFTSRAGRARHLDLLKAMSKPTLHDRFRGCLVGHAIGDAIGAPFEGLTDDLIYHSFGLARDIVKHPPVEQLTYTDDTQMMIGVAEALLEHGQIIPETLCRAFTNNYEPNRGYGQGARKILEAMKSGQDVQALATTIFSGGSYGNGAAMRVSPIGLLFHDDEQKIKEQARLSAMPTHVHPLGIEGAILIASAIGYVIRENIFDRQHFFRTLATYVCEDEFLWQLSLAAKLKPGDSLASFGNSIEAHHSVVTSLACFAENSDSFTDVIARAIALGNDTDTIAAMAGAISGAYLGIQAIPQHYIDMYENGSKGIGYIDSLARRLYDIWRRMER